MLEYQLDQVKIMDFFLIDKFWARELFFLYTLYKRFFADLQARTKISLLFLELDIPMDILYEPKYIIHMSIVYLGR